MNSRPVGWKNYLPSVVLVGILAVLLIINLSAGIGGAPPSGVPPLTAAVAATLLLIGLAAGFLGGIIGTGGCSVM
ncbi:MAG: hypothetical protein ACUVXJ_19330, partial [Phycisphaerae bacterium]